jgi:hypothetical protein
MRNRRKERNKGRKGGRKERRAGRRNALSLSMRLSGWEGGARRGRTTYDKLCPPNGDQW